jgi:hypothetical protein
MHRQSARMVTQMSSDARIGVGVTVWGVPLGIAFVPGAFAMLPVLIAVSCFGVWLVVHEMLRRRRRLQGTVTRTGAIDGKNISVNQSGGITGDVNKGDSA